jgi:hypothetical protein
MILPELSITDLIGCQLRAAPDQRSGRFALAVLYNA